ncbi:hypothetical protein [Parasphingorhabdus flavimaris]|uniref:Acid phosphatase n=1 Tax=Parasphingorhabdus flavimaris TaxID=266812 RepID=A0ABX2N6D0_9SPHN|nr:hypothetical protein [Parasphingorhabdus flavimaris]NVD29286.1 hypothetical protein [Parasphingorhabdus flavimaris]|tara:strand:+ start:24990 stop:25934 length:945 start_codon:yes stop_codon:yes gene_type:complete
MSRIGPIFLTLSVSTLLSGCVAALLPLAAVGGLAKNQIDRTKAKRELVASGAIDLARKSGSVTVGPGRSAGEPSPVAGKIFSGKGGAYEMAEVDLDGDAANYISRFFQPVGPDGSPYAAFAAYALTQSAKLEAGEGVESVVLVPRVDIFKPQTIGCAGKPLAVAIDLDDMTGRDWTESETLYRQNGLIEVLTSLRAAEISVIWLSDQPASASATISAILGDAGFSQPESDDFLFLDRGGEDRKQVRRWDAARNYCIVAMAGDDRADFDELYDYLRDPDGAITLENMFDNGWFLTPPPLVEANEPANATPVEKEG